MNSGQKRIAIIGGGPAGLRAAEVAVLNKAMVTLYDAKPSVGRKFLVAGKSGLNLTNDAPLETFIQKYHGQQLPQKQWASYITRCDNHALREWARSLGVETFVASGGKVFPVTKKAAPILRRWVLRLRNLGVSMRMNHRLKDLKPGNGNQVEVTLLHKDAVITKHYDAVVLAMGGGSWPQTGSDGTWVSLLRTKEVDIEPLKSDNCGWECAWTLETLAIAEGQPIHHVKVRAGDTALSGELMVTRYGLEGHLIYQLGRALRVMTSPSVEIDFKPVFSYEHMVKKMESARRNLYREAQLRWKLSPAVCAILRQLYGEFATSEALAAAAKKCRISLTQARPIAEAISTSGGVSWSSLNSDLMLKKIPGVYCAGEMIDWEAPTGGYLIQACFATGSIAGKAASE